MSHFHSSRRSSAADRPDINGNPPPATAPPAMAAATHGGSAPLPQNVNYVLRRYGGLNVFVPSIPIGNNRCGGTLPSPTRFQRRSLQRSVDPAEVLSSSSGSSDYLNLGDTLDGRPAPIKDPFGKFTPLFGGRIVLGSGKKMFIASLLFLGLLIATTTLQKERIFAHCGGLPVYVSGIVLSVINFYILIVIGTTDPGVVPKTYSLDELLRETEEYRARYPEERYFRYCNKCRTSRPPRTFHCPLCEICIRQQDTHLWIAGTCVGERNRRAYFLYVLFQTLLAVHLLTTSLIIAPHMVKGAKGYTHDLVILLSQALAGIGLLFFPQSGVFMLIYKLYLLGVGRTCREEYRKYHCYDTFDCVVDKRSACVNIGNFFCRKSLPSAFRRKLNRLDPESLHSGMPDPWILEQTIARRPRLQINDSRDLIQMQNFIEPEVDDDDMVHDSATGTIPENIETRQFREAANYARGKSTPSVPLFEHSLTPLLTRIKMPRKSKPSSILQQQISAHHQAAQLPKATVSYHKRQKLPLCLSDGCIPRTRDGLPEMIQLSRATQLRRIIQMILLRDRDGLIEMSNRVNIAALVGMNRFDPDNLQLLELNNGLPMIAPRRRENDQGNHRLGAGVLGIPQMVAAGLLPTARDLASSVETLGRGRVRRLPPVGRQRYVPITVVGNPATGHSRRAFIEQNPMAAHHAQNANMYVIPTPATAHNHHHHRPHHRLTAMRMNSRTPSRNPSPTPTQPRVDVAAALDEENNNDPRLNDPV